MYKYRLRYEEEVEQLTKYKTALIEWIESHEFMRSIEHEQALLFDELRAVEKYIQYLRGLLYKSKEVFIELNVEEFLKQKR